MVLVKTMPSRMLRSLKTFRNLTRQPSRETAFALRQINALRQTA